MVSSLNNRPWLAFMEKLGGSVPSPRETELPQLFCCRLEEQPDHLVAGRYLTSQAGAELVNDRLLVNPNCVFTKMENYLMNSRVSPGSFPILTYTEPWCG